MTVLYIYIILASRSVPPQYVRYVTRWVKHTHVMFEIIARVETKKQTNKHFQ